MIDRYFDECIYSKSVFETQKFECISVILKKTLDLSVFFISLFQVKVIGLQKRPFSNWSDNCLNQLKIASHLFQDYNTFRARTHKKKHFIMIFCDKKFHFSNTNVHERLGFTVFQNI